MLDVTDINGQRKLAGCVPIDFGINLEADESVARIDRLRFFMVTARRRPSLFIFPKGGVHKKESEAEAAVRETLEEAGLLGKLLPSNEKPTIVPLSLIQKKDGTVDEDESTVETLQRKTCQWYVMKVSQSLDDWSERDSRTRHILTAKEALASPNIRPITRELIQTVIKLIQDGQL